MYVDRFFIPVPDTTGSFTVKSIITGSYSILSVQNEFQQMFIGVYNGLIEQNKKYKIFDINQKLKNNKKCYKVRIEET